MVCVKVDTDWFACHQAFDDDRVPPVLGPELIANVYVRRAYRSLRGALETELPNDNYNYLQIWQAGRWVTVALDANEEQTPHVVVDQNGGCHMLKKGTGKMGPYDACAHCSLSGKRCHMLNAECGSDGYYVSVPTA